MDLSNEDKFCEELSASKTVDSYTENLDFHSHGDDILFTLFLFVLVTTSMDGDGTYDIVWQSCDDENFGSGIVETTLAEGLAEADLAAGVFVVQNAPLPRGLKRYQRLAFKPTLAEGESVTTAPAFSAYLTPGRVDPIQ